MTDSFINANAICFAVSKIMPTTKEECAVFGEGFGNGFIVIARRLMAQGLLTARDPKQ